MLSWRLGEPPGKVGLEDGFHMGAFTKKGIPTVFIVCRRNPESLGPKLPIYGWFMMENPMKMHDLSIIWRYKQLYGDVLNEESLKPWVSIHKNLICMSWGTPRLPELGNLRMSSVWGFY